MATSSMTKSNGYTTSGIRTKLALQRSHASRRYQNVDARGQNVRARRTVDAHQPYQHSHKRCASLHHLSRLTPQRDRRVALHRAELLKKSARRTKIKTRLDPPPIHHDTVVRWKRPGHPKTGPAPPGVTRPLVVIDNTMPTRPRVFCGYHCITANETFLLEAEDHV